MEIKGRDLAIEKLTGLGEGLVGRATESEQS